MSIAGTGTPGAKDVQNASDKFTHGYEPQENRRHHIDQFAGCNKPGGPIANLTPRLFCNKQNLFFADR